MTPPTLVEEKASPAERYLVEQKFTELLNPVVLAVGLLLLVMLLWAAMWGPTAL